MIIVFNLAGAIVAILGLVVAAIAAVGTGSLVVGLIALAGIWIWFGRAKDSGVAPSVFYIPMCYWGILAGILVFPAISIEMTKNKEDAQQAPFAVQLKADEEALAKDESDEPAVSQSIRDLFADYTPEDAIHVRVRSQDDSMLILIEVDNLKEISDRDRKYLLQEVTAIADSHQPGVKAYTGIKGRFMYGAVSTPDGYDEVGGVVQDARLLAFYQAVEAVADNSTTTEEDSTKLVSKELTDEGPEESAPSR